MTRREIVTTGDINDPEECVELQPRSDSLIAKDETTVLTTGTRPSWSNHTLGYYASIICHSFVATNLASSPFNINNYGLFSYMFLYILMIGLVGWPLLVMEMSLGQYYKAGAVTIWKNSPVCGGIGVLAVAGAVMYAIVSQVYASFSLRYITLSIFMSAPPWTTCHNHWNQPLCVPEDEDYIACNNFTDVDNEMNTYFNINHAFLCSVGNESNVPYWKLSSPSIDYAVHEIFGDYHNYYLPRGISPTNVLFFFISWVITFLIIFKGIHWISKVMVVFSIAFYFILFALFILGLTSDNKLNLLLWNSGIFTEIWIYKTVFFQVMLNLCIGRGSLGTLSSYSNYNNNFIKDSIVMILFHIVTMIIGTVTMSILIKNNRPAVDTYERSFLPPEPKVFEIVPSMFSKLSFRNGWTCLFFLCFFIQLLGRCVWLIEVIITGIIDTKKIVMNNRIIVSAVVCGSGFLLGLLFITKASIEVMLGFERGLNFSGLVSLLHCFFLTFIITHKKYIYMLEEMIGKKCLLKWPWICCHFITPIILIINLVFSYEWNLAFFLNVLLSIIPFIYALVMYLRPSTRTFESIARPTPLVDENNAK